ncbi:hypothetical protein B0F90DRAFT_1728224 [Multifurca ochricompacta]|uniref:DHHA2 domain-containing protein n=1 Tax=Multifurca ochricompacta TaxID=376703 RepID=A0AAD4M2V8_9AGAM|nr:hypothetical protein B0F90DRAFT_1728224 [Multifurca ochricompacta]
MSEVVQSIQSSNSSPVPSNLPEFLWAQRAGYLRALEQGEVQKDLWTISMGNEAGDLDSLASAVAYAWYATHHVGRLTVPLLQTPHADIYLRTENVYALELSGIDPAHLLTGDELPSNTSPAIKYALLDHNTLAGRFAEDERARVVAIVDHHVDENHHLDASPRIVEVPTGSCSSLVARLIQNEWPEGMSRAIARLLLCAVLIDTGGLKAGGKAEATDRKVAPFLLERAELTDAKGERELLSPRDLLRRDYKEYRLLPSWDNGGTVLVGLASVPRSIEAITGGDKRGGKELATACAAWLEEKGIDALGVLTSWKEAVKQGEKGKHRREMLWFVRNDKEIKHRLWKGLEGSKELELKRKEGEKYIDSMEEVVEGKNVAKQQIKMRMYEQGNAKATRKVTAPLVKMIIESKAMR